MPDAAPCPLCGQPLELGWFVCAKCGQTRPLVATWETSKAMARARKNG